MTDWSKYRDTRQVSDEVLHDFRPGVYPGVEALVGHLTDTHAVSREAALAANLGLLHRLLHGPWSLAPNTTEDREEG